MSFNVHFTYDPASGGYALKMTGMRNKLDWEQLKLFTGAIKGCIASSDRDYDPNQKTWYIDPKHFKTVKILIESAFDKNNIFIIEAPEASEQGYTQTFHSSEADLTKLWEISSTKIRRPSRLSAITKRKSFIVNLRWHIIPTVMVEMVVV
jgi:hypothetical protein